MLAICTLMQENNVFTHAIFSCCLCTFLTYICVPVPNLPLTLNLSLPCLFTLACNLVVFGDEGAQHAETEHAPA